MTPDEIKSGLERCSSDECHGDHVGCPYITSTMCIMDMANDALAYIKQLEHRLASVDDTRPAWISVKDRLPEPSTYVLAITSPGTLSVGRNIIVADYIHPKDENKGIFVMAYAGYDDKSIVNVTHWMPLPDMTKEDEQHNESTL